MPKSFQDGNGVIENEELRGFIRDLIDFLGKVSSDQLINQIRRWWQHN